MIQRIGRWQIEWHQRAIYIQQLPKPGCRDCGGEGGFRDEPDSELCPCWDPARAIRIPLWTRRAERYPF